MRFREKAIFNGYRLLRNLGSSYPLYTEQDKKSSPFFILSSGRSGTTLLRTMLTRGGEVIIPPESNLLIPELTVRYLKTSSKDWSQIISHLFEYLRDNQTSEYLSYWNLDLDKLKQLCLQLPDEHRSLHRIIQTIYCDGEKHAKLWGDKTPILLFWQDYLFHTFPNAKYIYLVRDGRDAVVSMIRNFKNYDIDSSIKRWNKSCEVILKSKRILPENRRMILIYENLVTNPGENMKQVCDFLEVNYSAAMLDSKIQINLGDTILSHHAKTKKPINTNSIGNWEKFLNSNEIKQINKKLHENLTKFGYEL